jgi:hypothetical protein
VHTVLIDGEVVKYAHKLVRGDLAAAEEAVGRTVEYARSTMGGEAWRQSVTPESPAGERIPNPCRYTDYGGGRTGTSSSTRIDLRALTEP